MLILLTTTSLGWAVQKQYSPAKLLEVQRKTRQKVDMYLVNTPVMSEVLYYEILVRTDQSEYRAEYTPRHAEEELPESWVAGAELQIRLEKHYLILKRQDGGETRWILLKTTHIKK